VEHVTCLGCGCTCDDIDVRIENGHILEAGNACELGRQWFGDGRVPARARVDGRDVAVDDALDAAAALLAAAVRPLVYLAPDISCEAQREAIALADLLHASLDSVTSSTAMPTLLAAQERGRASATLGEIRNRADVVVFWGVDPALRYPRYSTRYAPDPVGLHVGDGRRSRQVIAVDVGDAHGPADADVRVAIGAGREVATLTELRSLAAGRDVPNLDPQSHVRVLIHALLAARYAVIVSDAEAGAGPDSGRAGALIALTHALNGPTRCALSTLRAGGNRVGADALMTSQTGYPAAVDFSRGYPRYRPWAGAAADRLVRAEVDAVAVIGAAAQIPPKLREMLVRVPCVAIGPRASEGAFAAGRSVIDTGIAGIHDEGTAMRMDDVLLPIRRVVGGPPGAAPTVRALVDRLTKTDADDATTRRIGTERP